MAVEDVTGEGGKVMVVVGFGFDGKRDHVQYMTESHIGDNSIECKKTV